MRARQSQTHLHMRMKHEDFYATLINACDHYLSRNQFSQHDALRDAWKHGAMAAMEVMKKELKTEADRMRAKHDDAERPH